MVCGLWFVVKGIKYTAGFQPQTTNYKPQTANRFPYLYQLNQVAL